MNSPPHSLSDGLQEVSLRLSYPRWLKGLFVATIVSFVLLAVLPLYALIVRVIEDREEKEWVAISLLVFGSVAAVAYFARHFGGLSETVEVSEDRLKQGQIEIAWSDVTSVWDSAFFGMLRIKDRKRQVLTFFPGLIGYSTLATIAKEKKKWANRVGGGN